MQKCPICHTEVAADGNKLEPSLKASTVVMTSKKAATGL